MSKVCSFDTVSAKHFCGLDLCWLKAINNQRKAEELHELTEYELELAMDQYEKEWFHLTKDLQRLTQDPWSPEESVCNICNSGECENSNAIVFCDGCNLAVHQGLFLVIAIRD